MIVATGENEAARVADALDELGQRDVQSLLLEGGPHLAGAFLEAGEIDEARMFLAPLLLGGTKAKTAVEGIGIEDIASAQRPTAVETERIDDRRSDHRPLPGVVRCSRVWWPRPGRSNRSSATAAACACVCAASWPASSARATRWRSTASA